MATVRVLIINDDEVAGKTLASVLESEGWTTEVATGGKRAWRQLRRGPWHLVLADASTSIHSERLFDLLKELALADGPVRVLFLVPGFVAEHTRQYLEWHRLPYTTTPIRLDDFLEHVGELLLQTGTIQQPLRRVRQLARERPRSARRAPQPAHGHAMFANRDDYLIYDEDELRRFEEEEKKREEEKRKKQKRSEIY